MQPHGMGTTAQLHTVEMSRRIVADMPALVWPSALVRPSCPPKLVYLDLNHWIYLSQAASGARNGAPYLPALETCRRARVAGRAVFVLSGAHYMELTKIADPAKRRRIAEVMEELSGFTTLLSRQVVVRLEIDALLDDRLGPAPEPKPSFNLLGYGVGHTFGKRSEFTIRNKHDGSDASDITRTQIGAAAFDKLMMEVNRLAERKLLAGPEDSEVPDLLKLGYVADIAEEGAQKRADQETEQRLRHEDTEWGSGGKLADVVMAREVIFELHDALLEALSHRGRGIRDVKVLFADTEASRTVVRSMPVSYVSALLKTEQHRNKSKLWISNDIFDIDAMSLAVPYCDIVVTEKYRCHDLRLAKLESRMNTVILRRLSELAVHL